MEFLFIYLGIGLLVVLWDFRQYGKILYWRVRHFNTAASDAMFLGYPMPIIKAWDMPRYAREKNLLMAAMLVTLWPIKLPHTLGFVGFLRNLRAGRIKIHGREFGDETGVALDGTLAKYKNIINLLARGSENQEWIEFKIDDRTIVIHDGNISYDRTLEALGCPKRAKHTLFTLRRTGTHGDKIMWEVDESHNPFKVRMAGHGSSDSYEEDAQGNIIHVEQKNSWIS